MGWNNISDKTPPLDKDFVTKRVDKLGETHYSIENFDSNKWTIEEMVEWLDYENKCQWTQ